MAEIKAAPLVWINGFPGSGKLTVAKEVAKLHSEAIVLDNHKLIDPVAAKFPRTHPDYQKERYLYRQAVLNEYVHNAATLSRMVIFTDFQSTNELGRDVAMEYKDAARESGRPFIPIYLTCELDVNIRRIDSTERVTSGTTKLTDGELLRALHGSYKLFYFDCCPGFTVDTTKASSLETAAEILRFIWDKEDDEI